MEVRHLIKRSPASPSPPGDSGPRPGVVDAGLPVANSDGSAVDKLAANAVADVQAFWKKELPVDFDKEFTPVKGLISLVRIGTPPQQGAQGGIGGFAAIAEIALRFALAVEHATGHAVDGPSTGQLTACQTGMWAGTITPGDQGALQLSPGDLDEAVAEMLMGSSLIAADVNGATVPSGFARVQAFRDGFTSAGPAICASKYGS